MSSEAKREAILTNLTIQNGLFNSAKCPDGELDFQFTFKEPEGTFVFCLSVRNK